MVHYACREALQINPVIYDYFVLNLGIKDDLAAYAIRVQYNRCPRLRSGDATEAAARSCKLHNRPAGQAQLVGMLFGPDSNSIRICICIF